MQLLKKSKIAPHVRHRMQLLMGRKVKKQKLREIEITLSMMYNYKTYAI